MTEDTKPYGETPEVTRYTYYGGLIYESHELDPDIHAGRNFVLAKDYDAIQRELNQARGELKLERSALALARRLVEQLRHDTENALRDLEAARAQALADRAFQSENAKLWQELEATRTQLSQADIDITVLRRDLEAARRETERLRESFRRRIESEDAIKERLIGKINEARGERDAAYKGLAAVETLMRESKGVDGLHLNGDVAMWDELRAGGKFEEWLLDFDAALSRPTPQAGEE